MKQTTAQINRIVAQAYSALDIVNQLGTQRYREVCFNLAVEEEKRHRQGAPTGHVWPKGASVNNAARMFVCVRVAQALTAIDDKKLTIKDLLFCQQSAVYAASIVANYGAQILTAWQRVRHCRNCRSRLRFFCK